MGRAVGVSVPNDGISLLLLLLLLLGFLAPGMVSVHQVS